MFELGFTKTIETLEITKTAWKKHWDSGDELFWSVAGCTVHDQKTNEIREINMYNLDEITVDCRCKWALYLLWMKDTHICKLVYEYTPTGRKNIVQPRKICWDATPTEDRTSLDGLYPVAAAVDDDDEEELGICI